MNAIVPMFSGVVDSEISALIGSLHETERRLDSLTGGEIDTVADREGRTYLLRHAQDHLRHREAAKQAAILNALPANIALIDPHGVIVSVNDAWRQFAGANVFHAPGAAVGVNYLDICDRVDGNDATGFSMAGSSIRSVLAGEQKFVSIEYSCHSPTEQRWFRMTVTPLADDRAIGAVVMHLDITLRKQADIRIHRLNRGYVVLSQINTLIVRVGDRDELFRDACRIAVDSGHFLLAWIGVVDAVEKRIVPVASAGADGDFLREVEARLSLLDDAPLGHGPSARAVREKKAVVVNDLASDPRIRHPETHTSRGIHSLVSLPLIVDGKAVAVLGLHAADADYFDDAEMKLLRELAGDIAFAIDHIGKAEKLNYQAYYDSLTGLANQTLFLERAAQCLRSAGSAGHGAAMVLVDLERFKSINDSLGQPAGDELLKQVATWMSQALVDPTLLTRVGSDHFAMMLPEARAPGDVARALEKMIKAFHEHPFMLDGTVFRISAKFGVAVFPDDGADAGGLFGYAEAALKKAKAGDDRYLFYTQKMTETVARKLTLENQLRQALDNEEFVLHYQPKINLQSGRLTSAEALIRWSDPRTGLVPPGMFIPILEETGLIYEVGRWALRKSLADYLRWRNAGLFAVRIAVNVSPLQLRHPGFIGEIEQILSVHPLAAEGLELEITESMIMADVKQSIASLQALRAMGLPIAIDDFGTGFSSLGYLSKLPVDTLKIDRSFIMDMTQSPDGLALVSTMIHLGHSLRLKIVAEGVETEEQMNLLRLLKCDEMQGYLFSKPVPCDVFEEKFLSLVSHN
jgi:diguanylate cyclase (GGDEF)-like protein